MKITCLHGYYYFQEVTVGDISEFISLYGLPLVLDNNRFTFEKLQGAPKYSVIGNDYLGATAIKTFEGLPHEIFKANELVYDFNSGNVVPKNQIGNIIKLYISGRYYSSNGLIVAGSLIDDGRRVMDYSATFTKRTRVFKYTEVNIV